jgi:hypothetical protein
VDPEASTGALHGRAAAEVLPACAAAAADRAAVLAAAADREAVVVVDPVAVAVEGGNES